MRILSFENDLDSLRLALLHSRLFPYLRHAGPPAIADGGEWQSKQFAGLSWQLLEGNFLEMIAVATAAPDAIFYDMFSSKVSADLWTLKAFEKLWTACGDTAAELFTYTCSTSVRVALLAAGFYVARGRSVGAKEETTIAVTPASFRSADGARHNFLSLDWVNRWNRSNAKFPAGLLPGQQPAFEQVIRQHEQFRPSAIRR